MIPSQTFQHPVLGVVKINTRSNARNISARWKDGIVVVSAPKYISSAELMKGLEELQAAIMAAKPAALTPAYFDGFSFDTDDWSFVLHSSRSVAPGYVTARRLAVGQNAYEVLVHPATDFTDAAMHKAISNLIKKIAAVMGYLLIEQAKAEAKELGLSDRVADWSVGRGMRRLGCCNTRGEISLSSTLMFMPRRLRRSTITHELAHLTHMDHSPAFYALWDKYLGYSHLISKQELRALRLPC